MRFFKDLLVAVKRVAAVALRLFSHHYECLDERLNLEHTIRAAGYEIEVSDSVVCGFCGAKCGIHRPLGGMDYYELALKEGRDKCWAGHHQIVREVFGSNARGAKPHVQR